MSAIKSKVIAAGVASVMALGIIAGQASASATDPSSIVVRYNDLDLNTKSGAQTLYERIDRAADEICPPDSLLLIQHVAWKRCHAAVVERAIASVRSPQLAAIYEERMHHGTHAPV